MSEADDFFGSSDNPMCGTTGADPREMLMSNSGDPGRNNNQHQSKTGGGSGLIDLAAAAALAALGTNSSVNTDRSNTMQPNVSITTIIDHQRDPTTTSVSSGLRIGSSSYAVPTASGDTRSDTVGAPLNNNLLIGESTNQLLQQPCVSGDGSNHDHDSSSNQQHQQNANHHHYLNVHNNNNNNNNDAASFTSLFTPEKVLMDDLLSGDGDGDDEAQLPNLPVDQLPPGSKVWIGCAAGQVRMAGHAIWSNDLLPYCGTGVQGTVVRHSGRHVSTGGTTVVAFEHAVGHGEASVRITLTFPRAALSLTPPLRTTAWGRSQRGGPGGNGGAAGGVGGGGGGGVGGGGGQYGLDPRGGPGIVKRLSNEMVVQQRERRLSDFDRDATVSCREDVNPVLAKLQEGDVSAARCVPVPPPAKPATDMLLAFFNSDDVDITTATTATTTAKDETTMTISPDKKLCSRLAAMWADECGDSTTAKLRAWRALLAVGDAARARELTTTLPEKVPASVRDFVAAVNGGTAAVTAAIQRACGPSFSLCPHHNYEFGRTLHCDRYLVRGDEVARHPAGPLAVAVTGADLPVCGNCCATAPVTFVPSALHAARARLSQQQQFAATQTTTTTPAATKAARTSAPSKNPRQHPLLLFVPIADGSSSSNNKSTTSASELQRVAATRTSSGWIPCPRGSAQLFCSPRCARDAWAGFFAVERGANDPLSRAFRSMFGFLQFQAPNYSDEIRGAFLLVLRCISIAISQWRQEQQQRKQEEQQQPPQQEVILTSTDLQVALARLGAFPAPSDIRIDGDLLKFMRVTLHPALQDCMHPTREAPALTLDVLVAAFAAVFQYQRVLAVEDPFKPNKRKLTAADQQHECGTTSASSSLSDASEDSGGFNRSGNNVDHEDDEDKSGGRQAHREKQQPHEHSRSSSQPPPVNNDVAPMMDDEDDIDDDSDDDGIFQPQERIAEQSQLGGPTRSVAPWLQQQDGAVNHNNHNALLNEDKNHGAAVAAMADALEKAAMLAEQQQQRKKEHEDDARAAAENAAAQTATVAAAAPVRRFAVLSPLCSSCSRNSEAPNCRLALLGSGDVALVVTSKVIPKNVPLQCAL